MDGREGERETLLVVVAFLSERVVTDIELDIGVA